MAPGVAGLSLGTSGALRLAITEPMIDAGRTLFCYALTDSVWVVGGSVSNGGGVVRWAGRALAPDVGAAAGEAGADAAVLDLAGRVPAGSDGLVMVPYLLPERAPLWDPEIPGAYLGLRRDHTRAHLIRAAVEGVCLQLRVILDQLERLHPVTTVHATGGALRAGLWQEVLAAVLDRPVSVISDADGTALGAAALGLFALGRVPRLGDAVGHLSDPDAPPASPLSVAPDLVATYARLRGSLPRLIAALGPIADVFAGEPDPASGHDRGLGLERPGP
jgi:gluconokinase